MAEAVKNFPVIETVLSAQFEPISGLRTAHLGLLWNEFKETFPQTEERPPIEPVIEQFPEVPLALQGIKIMPVNEMPTPRLWFVSATGNEMIQVQRDRFIKNWRKEGEQELYPRYENIRPKFDRDFAIFKAFLEKGGFDSLSINQCEVSYVNHIVAGDNWTHFGDADKIFTFFRAPSANPPGSPEDLSVHCRFLIPDGGRAIGRLHVDIRPAIRNSDNIPMYVMNLTARGQIGDGFDFFEIGHRWIVDTFKGLTYERFHD